MSYEIIELEIEPELQDKLVEAFILANFSGASIDAFYNSYDGQDGKIEDQLYAAVLNEMINKAITEEMERMKNERDGDKQIDESIKKEQELEDLYNKGSLE